MSIPSIAPAAAVLAFVNALAAQVPLGTIYDTGPNFASRGGNAAANVNAIELFHRIDAETYAGFGFDPAAPGMRAILGIRVILQDQVANTPDTFALVVRTEDPARADFPLTGAPIGITGPLNTPSSTSQVPGAYALTITFTAPMLAPAGSDVFVGVSLPLSPHGSWPVDGLGVLTLSGAGLPGFGLPTTPLERASFAGVSVPSLALLEYAAPSQFWIDPLVAPPAGLAGATPTPFALNARSTNAFFAYPDARSPPRNAGRADDLTNRWRVPSVPDGTPVFFLADLGSFGPEIPLAAVVPGSQGVLCLGLSSMTVLSIRFTLSGEASTVITLPAALRSSIAGVPLLQQAVGLVPVQGIGIAGACTRQVL